MAPPANLDESWQSVVKQKKDKQNELLKPYLVKERDAVSRLICTVQDVRALQEQIFKGTWTIEQVVKAFASHAAVAHQRTNCLTEVLFDRALAKAKDMDVTQATSGKPLWGIPVTLKDQFNVTGYDSTIGYVVDAFKPASGNSVLVDMLERLGAVVLAKTNLPQSIMWCETENPIWGLTTHPSKPQYTPGGSTGGEGALLALKGSILGFGTDIGGSVRIPSSMCGLYALKPSSGRLPYHGVAVSTDGQEHVPSVVGPMARSLETLTHAMRSLIDLQPWTLDPRCVTIPWREDTFKSTQSRRLNIGLLLDDGIIKPHPPVTRNLKAAAVALEAAGHTVVPWEPIDHAECIKLMDEYYTADGGEDIRRAVRAGGEPLLPHVAALLSRGEAIKVIDYWALNKRKLNLQKAFLDRWQNLRAPDGRPLDVILMPTMPHSAVPHRCARYVGYTKVWNLLDYTALVLPYGVIDANTDVQLDAKEEPHSPRSELDGFMWKLYDPQEMHGLPLSLQIVGQRHEDEKVLGAALAIERVLLEARART